MGSKDSDSLIEEFLDFAFPPLCAGCGRYCENSQPICQDCLSNIDWFDSNFSVDYRVPGGEAAQLKLFAGAEYLDPMKSIIVAFKFNGVRSVVPVLVRGYLDHQRRNLTQLGECTLVPVPLHPSREYRRGYNQASLIAHEIGKGMGLPVNEDVLYRMKLKRPQSRLSESQRHRNIRGVFSADSEAVKEIEGKKIILVDDVITSGATISEAAVTLAKLDVEVVAALALAHGL